MIPLIKSEMLTHGWMTAGELTDIIAIAEMTPGPLGINCATFAGLRTAGFLGAVAANLGMIAPSLTLALAAIMFFEKARNNRWVDRALTGIRPSCVGMILGLVVSLFLSTYIQPQGIDIRSILIGLLAFYLLRKRDMSIPKVIGISAALGLIFC